MCAWGARGKCAWGNLTSADSRAALSTISAVIERRFDVEGKRFINVSNCAGAPEKSTYFFWNCNITEFSCSRCWQRPTNLRFCRVRK